MTRPPLVQLWAPRFPISLFGEAFSRDLQRAEREWRGEDRIWLSPGAKGITRWQTEEKGLCFYECLVPSEVSNVISIFHLDESRKVFPPLLLPDEWGNALPASLYLKWIETKATFMLGERFVSMEMPSASDGKISYQEVRVELEPGPIIPIASVNEEERSVRMCWPPPDSRFIPPVSPETESKDFYGELRHGKLLVDDQEVDVAIPEKNPEVRAITISLRWPEPFNLLFQTTGLDMLYHQGLMRGSIERLGQGQYDEVLREAEAWVNRFTGETEATLEKAWFMPKVLANVEAALFEVEGRLDIAANTLDELIKSEPFREKKQIPQKVLRVHSWLGYFWWEFYQDLRCSISIRLCQHCGTIIRGGHADRQYCNRQENPECHRGRNAEIQRRRRRRLSR